MRSCKACNATLAESEFHRHWNKLYGLYYFDPICRWCTSDKRKGQRTDKHNEYRKQPEDQVRARGIVKRAVKSGKLVKPTSCPECLTRTTSRNIHAHHHSGYDKPLDVIWLCRWCHEEVHMRK